MSNRKRIGVNVFSFSGEISTHRNRNNAVSSIRYRADRRSLKLRSITELQKCLDNLDRTMGTFNTIVESDIANMETFRDKWIGTDAQMFGRAAKASCHASGGSEVPNTSVWPRGHTWHMGE